MSEGGDGKFLSTLKTIEKLAALGVVIFLVYEMFKFNGSGVGKGLGQMFGAVGGLMHWLAGHPNTFIAAIFTAILALPATALLNMSRAYFERKAEQTRLAREATADAFKAAREANARNGVTGDEAATNSVRNAFVDSVTKDDKAYDQSRQRSGESVTQGTAAQMKENQTVANANAQARAENPNEEGTDDGMNAAENEFGPLPPTPTSPEVK